MRNIYTPPFFPFCCPNWEAVHWWSHPFDLLTDGFFIALTEQGTDISQNFNYQDSNVIVSNTPDSLSEENKIRLTPRKITKTTYFDETPLSLSACITTNGNAIPMSSAHKPNNKVSLQLSGILQPSNFRHLQTDDRRRSLLSKLKTKTKRSGLKYQMLWL